MKTLKKMKKILAIVLAVMITVGLTPMLPGVEGEAKADTNPNYLTFTAEGGSVSIRMGTNGGKDEKTVPEINTIDYRTKQSGSETWSEFAQFAPSGSGTNWSSSTINLSDGESIQLKSAGNTTLSTGFTEGLRQFFFEGAGTVKASGSVTSLLDGVGAASSVTIGNNCFCGLFYACSKLTEAPELPASTLANNCYEKMFYECKKLKKAPALPATVLAKNCYQSMFEGCCCLAVRAPESGKTPTWVLPTLTGHSEAWSNAYSNMISNTSGAVKTIPDTGGSYMVEGVPAITCATCTHGSVRTSPSDGAAPGTTITVTPNPSAGYEVDKVYKTVGSGSQEEITKTNNAYTFEMPNADVTVSATFVKANYLKFTAQEAGASVSLTRVGSPAIVNLKYSTNGGSSWSSYTIGDAISLSSEGSAVEFKSASTGTLSQSDSNYYKFVTSKNVNASGSVMSLIDGTGNTTSLSGKTYCFYKLFDGCTSLKTAPTLSATTLANNCYQQMFNGCTGLTAAPTLSATTMTESCYEGMFSGCTGLTAAPTLSSTALEKHCYKNMFNGCTQLTNAPALSATSLAYGCYEGMFAGCTSLATPPELKAPNLENYCYQNMFNGCSALKMNITDETAKARWAMPAELNGQANSMLANTHKDGQHTVAANTYYAVGNAVTYTAGTGGSFTYAHTVANQGDTVTVSPIADSDYVVDKVYKQEGSEPETELQKVDGGYSFEMPGKNVSVRATFAEIPDPMKNARYYVSLTLNESMDVNLEIQSLGSGFETNNITVKVNNVAIKNDLSYDSVNNILKCVLCSKAIKNMSESINIDVLYNGVTVKSVANYSIPKYCRNILGKTSSGDKIYNLCQSVLNYGERADMYFNNKTHEQSNIADGYRYNYSGITIPDELNKVENVKSANYEADSMSLTTQTDSKMALNYYITTTKPLTKDIVEITNENDETVPNRNIDVTARTDGTTGYVVSIKNIGASKLSRYYTLKVNGDSAFKVKYGVYSYCYAINQDNTKTEELRTLCKSIYKYGEAAKAYASNN